MLPSTLKVPLPITKILLVQLLFVLLSVGFFTLLERKVLGYIQLRKGPNKPGPIGLLVPFADATKLLTKECNSPSHSNKLSFHFVPCFALIIPILVWSCYPAAHPVLYMKFSILWVISVSALGVYVILMMGWGSNRKYSFLGSVRAVAQSVSYEVCLTIILIHWMVFFGYILMEDKTICIGVFLFGIILLLAVRALAETNRAPFDFSEGESELVSGFNTEYSSVPFVMIFLAEYISLLFISVLMSMTFNSTGYMDLIIFAFFWAVFFLWTRGTFPRFRYDQLIALAWKSFLPIVLGSGVFVLSMWSRSIKIALCFHRKGKKER